MLASMSQIDQPPYAPPVNWSDLGVSELLPTGTVTLLLADVEGSTRLWETQPDEMTAAVARLDRAVRRVAEHGGVRPVEQGEGDSFVIAFGRASDAVACALELQRAPLAPIRLRIGMHTGEVQLRDEGNYIGPTINRTARLRDLAHGGQTVLSGTTERPRGRPAARRCVAHRSGHASAAGSPAARTGDAAVPPRSSQRVSAAADGQYRCRPDIFRRSSPASSAASTQIAEVRQLLADNRLVTLTGAGGAGKTAWRFEIAAQMAGEFADGVWYVDLAPITDPEWCRSRSLARWDCPTNPDARRWTRCCGSSATGDMLMVLDNCEHLLDAMRRADRRALGACPRSDVPGDEPRTDRRRRRSDLAGAVAVPGRRGRRAVHRPCPAGAARFTRHRRQRRSRRGDLPAPRRHAAGDRARRRAGPRRCRWPRSSTACTTGSGC